MQAVIVSGFHGLESEKLSFMRDQFPHWPWCVRSKFITMDFASFWFSPSASLAQWLKGRYREEKNTYKRHQLSTLTSVSADGLQIYNAAVKDWVG